MVVKDTKSGKKREFTLKKGQHIHSSMTKYTM